MPYRNYIYELLGVIDGIDDTIDSNSNTPQAASALQLDAVAGSGVLRQAFNYREYPVDNCGV